MSRPSCAPSSSSREPTRTRVSALLKRTARASARRASDVELGSITARGRLRARTSRIGVLGQPARRRPQANRRIARFDEQAGLARPERARECPRVRDVIDRQRRRRAPPSARPGCRPSDRCSRRCWRSTNRSAPAEQLRDLGLRARARRWTRAPSPSRSALRAQLLLELAADRPGSSSTRSSPRWPRARRSGPRGPSLGQAGDAERADRPRRLEGRVGGSGTRPDRRRSAPACTRRTACAVRLRGTLRLNSRDRRDEARLGEQVRQEELIDVDVVRVRGEAVADVPSGAREPRGDAQGR